MGDQRGDWDNPFHFAFFLTVRARNSNIFYSKVGQSLYYRECIILFWLNMKKTVLLAFVLVLLLTGLPLSVVGLLGLQMAHASSYKDNFKVEFSSSAAYVSVPFHYQSNIYYCGPTALEMVFDYYGEDIPQTEIADVARTHPNVTYLDELRRATHFSNLSTSLGDEMPGNVTGYSARKIGYAAFEQGGLTLDDLKTLISKGQPLIVLMWWTPSKVYGHYRVVVGYNETHIITHDPWNKDVWGGTYGGANTSITYSTFLDLWLYSGNWGLLTHPWNIELQMPSTVSKGDNFEVTANITYPCSTPFDTADYPASSCKATIQLQEGLELALGETLQHPLGNIIAGNPVQTSWSIHANETGFHNISVTVTGIVGGSVWTHGTYPSYNYEDEIGGSFTNSLSIINQTSRVHNIDSGKNFSTIQEAINDNETLDGHTILVDAGTYYEHVTIDKTIALVGENRSNTMLDGNGTDIIVLIFAENVCISGFTIQNGLCGICLAGPIGTTKPMMSDISNNIITSNEQGIDAIFSHNNTINDNLIQNNSRGIFLSSCGGTILRHNNMTHNSQNFGVGGYTLSDFTQNVDATNTVDGKPIYYWVNQRDKRIPADAGYVAAVNSLNITVENLNLKNNREGVLFAYTTNSTIENVNVSNCSYGFKLHNSNHNTILGNVVSNGEEGIRLQSSSDNIIISNAMINNTGYKYHAAGIHLIYGSSGNVINGNAMSDNYCGIRFTSSNGTIVQHNNFVNNTYQVLGASYDNVWDDGYPSGGNYWSDYSDTDFFSGPFQNETGSDGIGDTAHTIDANNTDSYPLMGMFSDFTVWDNETYHITTICNFTISDFNWGYRMNITGTWEKALYFNVFGPEDTVGFCRIMIPRAFLEGPYTVLFTNEVNSTELPVSNSTHVFLYITYNHSGHVMIVPEFPSLLILPLFMIATLLTVIVYRRKDTM